MHISRMVFFVTAIAGFSVFAASSEAANFKRIKKADDFNAKIVGKTLTKGPWVFVLKSNGTFGGSTPKGKPVGKWNWQKGYYCRALSIGKEKLPSDCQTVHFNGEEVYFVRDQGKGDKGQVYSVK